MNDSEFIPTPTPVEFASTETSSSKLPVLIPVIGAGLLGLGAFVVRKLRRKPDVATPLTEPAPTEDPLFTDD
jgi:hypothetical protein